jgi:hypothetical protein
LLSNHYGDQIEFGVAGNHEVDQNDRGVVGGGPEIV